MKRHTVAPLLSMGFSMGFWMSLSLGVGLAAGFGFVAATPVAAEALKWNSTLDGALTQAKATDRPVMLDIYAVWCGFCRKLRTEVYPSAQVGREAERFVLVSLDGEKQPGLMRKYGVTGFPTILFLDKNGIEIDRVSGYHDEDNLARFMRDVYQRRNAEGSLTQALQKNPESIVANFRTGVYFHDAGDLDRAREHFMRAWTSPQTGFADKRRDAAYNAAVVSMDMHDYAVAVSLWNAYIGLYPDNADDLAYAKYFRGLALKYAGQIDAARADLEYAARTLPSPADREAAKRVIASLR